MALVKVVPAKGARIRQPNRNGMVMGEKGDVVSTDDTFYIRLINSGDLVVVDEKAPQTKEAPTPAHHHKKKD